jgi:hypothetical protein
MTSFIQLTQNLFFHNALLLAQVEYNYSSEGKPPSPASMIVGLLIALFLIVAMWKVVHESRPARLGLYYPNL